MMIISLNCRVWTRDTKRASERFWVKRMERVRSFILERAPDVLCLQELSFPANLWIPWKYHRVGLSASHHIYVRKGVKARPLWFSMHHNAAVADGVRVINVHGTWRKCMEKVWERLRMETEKKPCVIVGDFNHPAASVEKNLMARTAPKASGVTFRNYSTGAQGDIDHCAAFGIDVVSCEVFDDGFAMSDHLPVVIHIEKSTQHDR